MSTRGSVTDVPAGPSPPGVRRPNDHRLLHRFAVAATSVTFLLIAVGGLVRTTGSGLGCPGWPRCFGRWLPPLEYHAVIEYSHRLTASIDVLLIALLAVVAWRRYRTVPRVFRPAVGALVLVIVQAILGGVVVKGDLQPLLVTVHFATAQVLAAVLVYATVASYSVEFRPQGRPDRLTVLARVVAGAAFVLLVVGAYVRGEGAGLVFRDWPLMDGRLIPSLSAVPGAAQFAHRALALVVGILVGVLAIRTWRERGRRPAAAALAVTAAGLYLLQVLVGAANVWSRLATAPATAHVALSSLIWGTLVAVAAVDRLGPRVGVAGPAGRSR